MRSLHRVVGLAAGVVLVVLGLTGSALVFREEIDRALNPELLVVAPAAERAALQPILDRVGREFPGEAVTRVRMPQRPDGTLELWLGAAPSRYVYADPYRGGAILGSRRPTEFLTGWLFVMHSHLLTGEAGHTVAGVAALLLVLLAVSGIVVWWPRRAPWAAWTLWRRALTVERGAGAARATYDLHRAVGFYASLFLLVGGVTGASLVFHETFERMAYLVTRTTPPAKAPARVAAPAPAGTSLGADSLLAIARRVQPAGVVSYLYLPGAPGTTFRVRQRLAGETHPNGKSFVHLDPATGAVVALEDGARAPAGGRLYSYLYPLHIGRVGGLPTRLLAFASGLALAGLAVTGVMQWRRRARAAHARGGRGIRA